MPSTRRRLPLPAGRPSVAASGRPPLDVTSVFAARSIAPRLPALREAGVLKRRQRTVRSLSRGQKKPIRPQSLVLLNGLCTGRAPPAKDRGHASTSAVADTADRSVG